MTDPIAALARWLAEHVEWLRHHTNTGGLSHSKSRARGCDEVVGGDIECDEDVLVGEAS